MDKITIFAILLVLVLVTSLITISSQFSTNLGSTTSEEKTQPSPNITEKIQKEKIEKQQKNLTKELQNISSELSEIEDLLS